jgi:hypothetical protein
MRPNLFLERIYRQITLFDDINDDIDNTGNKMIELEQIHQLWDDELGDDYLLEIVNNSSKSFQELKLLLAFIVIYLV